MHKRVEIALQAFTLQATVTTFRRSAPAFAGKLSLKRAADIAVRPLAGLVFPALVVRVAVSGECKRCHEYFGRCSLRRFCELRAGTPGCQQQCSQQVRKFGRHRYTVFLGRYGQNSSRAAARKPPGAEKEPLLQGMEVIARCQKRCFQRTNEEWISKPYPPETDFIGAFSAGKIPPFPEILSIRTIANCFVAERA